jgi:signal transduction histidine kinase
VPTITVTDTGIGIPADDMPHIWDRLFRGDRSRSAPGLGLGLGLVKAIVEAHGGEVKAESEVGEGARFTITFPPVSIITKL